MNLDSLQKKTALDTAQHKARIIAPSNDSLAKLKLRMAAAKQARVKADSLARKQQQASATAGPKPSAAPTYAKPAPVPTPTPAPAPSVIKTDTIAAIKPVLRDSISKPGKPHFFTGHLLPVKNTNPVPVNKQSNDWMFFSLMALVVLFTVTRVVHPRNLKQMRDALFSSTMSRQLIRDENLLFQRASSFLTVAFYISLAILLYNSSITYNWDQAYLPAPGFGRFFIFLVGVSIVYSLKLITLKAIGFTVNIEKAVTTYIFNVFLINNVLGILLIPILIGLNYMSGYFYEKLLILSFILVALAYTYRLVRGLMIGLDSSKFSSYYIFLYLCTFEIAPMLFFAKLLVK